MARDRRGASARALPGNLRKPDELGAVIAEAFHDLPPSRWLISDEADRRKIFPYYFRLHLDDAVAGSVIHTTPERSAAAALAPIGNWIATASLPIWRRRASEAATCTCGMACPAARCAVLPSRWQAVVLANVREPRRMTRTR